MRYKNDSELGMAEVEKLGWGLAAQSFCVWLALYQSSISNIPEPEAQCQTPRSWV